jgi:hypothetical protein
LILFGGTDPWDVFQSKVWSYNISKFQIIVCFIYTTLEGSNLTDIRINQIKNTASKIWYKPVSFTIKPVINAGPLIYKDKLFIFAGALDSGGSQATNNMIIYDIGFI